MFRSTDIMSIIIDDYEVYLTVIYNLDSICTTILYRSNQHQTFIGQSVKKNITKKFLWFFISNISFTDTKVEFIILSTCWKNAGKTFSFNSPHAVYRCISGNVKQKRGRRRIDPKRFQNSIWNMPFERHLVGFWWNVSAIPKINNVDKFHLSVYTYTWLL